jgi:hypothetical protein
MHASTSKHPFSWSVMAKISREYSVNMLDLMRCIRERLCPDTQPLIRHREAQTQCHTQTLTGMSDTGVTITSDIPRVTVYI